MSEKELREALSSLAFGADDEALSRALFSAWASCQFEHTGLPVEAAQAARTVDELIAAGAASAMERAARTALVRDAELGPPLLAYLEANASRSDVRLFELLEAALAADAPSARDLVASRVVEGPLLDALLSAPLLGDGPAVAAEADGEVRARLEILLWEAGASALQVPELGRWIWDRAENFEELIGRPARGSLRGRVLAARCLEVAVCGMSPMTDPSLVGRTLQVMQPLILHPEPMVWIHAARSFGRITAAIEPLEGTVLDWVHGKSPVLRQRALTAFASLPSHRLRMLAHEILSIVQPDDVDAWVLAAVAAATPYLFSEHKHIWEVVSSRILRGDGGAIAARALARGLASLWRRGSDRAAIERPFRQLRQLARRARTEDLDEKRRWLEVIAVTDPVDEAERDPLDLELGLENLVRVAAQYDDEEADARAARFAGTLLPTFGEARRNMLTKRAFRQRAASFSAVEGAARSLALRLWSPLLATRPGGAPIAEPDLSEAWKTIAAAPAELLDAVTEYRDGAETEATASMPEPETPEAAERFMLNLEVLALKLGGYALDACGEDSDLGLGRGPTAHDTCLWLRKLKGLTDGSREFPSPLQNALSAMFWRLVDATRGSALGEVDDVAWLGPFAAWWALVIDRPAILEQLGTALPMIKEGALSQCCDLADALRQTLSQGTPEGAWGPEVERLVGELRADDTELAAALLALAGALQKFAAAAGHRATLEALCLELVVSAERLRSALADPVRALRPVEQAPVDDSLTQATTENAPRMASVVSRAIKTQELALLEVWFAALGPTAAPLVEAAVQAAIKRTPPPPRPPKRKEPTTIGGYELVSRLGEGGIGSVWLVRKPGADRYFVLKIPKADALANATDDEREGILASFVEEARALAGLYHPNVANIIDRGVESNIPYLVLEYLIGTDLYHYSSASLMSLFELKSVVVETCAGLTALHNAGLVHRDIKPGNIWLRLPLGGGVVFDPESHRDPAHTPPLSSVVIDFGMVRAMRVAAEVGGKFVAGTPGFIAPEQVLDPVELDGRADVYALAGTIYAVTSGRKFFDDITDARERIIAHMRRDPMEDAERFKAFPASIVKLLRAGTATNWRDRPTPAEFGKAFAEAL